MNEMLIDVNALFTVILYLLGCILLIALIILSIKALKTIGKINHLVDDVQEKSDKMNGIFDFVDSTTDFINGFADHIIGGVAGLVTKLFEKNIKEKRKMSKEKKGLGKLFAGVAIGGALGVLFAPKKGKDTRADLKNKLDEMLAKVKDMDANEVKENIETKIEEIKEELEDLDKEKVIAIASKKAKQIQERAEDLVEYAIEKGTPVLEKAATAIREKAIDVTKEVLNRLETSDKKSKK